ncbi:2-oxoglutarate/malate transporter [Streptomyces sp. CAU 1734]|uniref:2-oxoglutarate/malate transporter n=1 Tax=Streptomyces sp. CAU 1734 TaxID=3140360 RepID=UPI003260A99C
MLSIAKSSRGFSAICGVAALGFALTIVLSNALLVPAGLPATGAGPGEVHAFFRTEDGALGAGSALTPLAWVLATLFGAGAVAALRPSERGRSEAWSLVGFAGLLLQNAAFAGVVAIRLALGAAAGQGDRPAAGLWALHEALFTLNGTFLALALLGLSVAGLRAGLIRPWHGGLGLLSAALLFGSAVLAPWIVGSGGPLGLLGLTGWLMWVVWVAAYGVALIRPARHHPSAGETKGCADRPRTADRPGGRGGRPGTRHTAPGTA